MREAKDEKSFLRFLGASIYDVRTLEGGPQKADKMNENYVRDKGVGGQKIRNFCGRHMWKPPYSDIFLYCVGDSEGTA